MRILITVSDKVWGGKQRYMTDIVSGLQDQGHKVLCVVEEGSKMAAALSRTGHDVTVVRPFSEYRDEAAAALGKLLRSSPGFHVLCVSGRHDAAAAQTAVDQTPARPMTVFYRHSAFPLEEEGPARTFITGADLVVATSAEQAVRQFPSGSIRGEALEVITSGVARDLVNLVSEADPMESRARLAIPEGAFVLAVPARLSWEKGVDRAVRAMVPVAERFPESLLVLAGDGPELGPVRALVGELGLAEHVLFTGHLDDVPPLLAAADAVVLPSVVPETGPLALKEAMAAGLPTIASRIGGIPEFVRHEATGLLVDDDAQLVAAMLRLLSDRAYAADLGQRARRVFLSEHLMEHRVRYFGQCLDRRAIRSLPPEDVLAELTWDDTRRRDEAHGGFVFVPRTSAISELSPSIYPQVRTAIDRRDPTLLLELPAESVLDTVELLYGMGALVRPQLVAA